MRWFEEGRGARALVGGEKEGTVVFWPIKIEATGLP